MTRIYDTFNSLISLYLRVVSELPRQIADQLRWGQYLTLIAAAASDGRHEASALGLPFGLQE
jgi:hypothetical protein